MGNTKNNKLKVKPIWIGAAAALIAVVVFIIFAVTGSSDKETDKVNVNLNNVDLNNGSDGAQVENKEQTTVEIQMTDSAVPVGSRFKTVAVVTPANTEQALVWSVSDSNILEVTNDGVVTVKAVGTATVSATVGDVTDAVIIEGIDRIEAGSKNNFPIYTMGDNTVSGNGSTGGNSGSGSNGSSGMGGNGGSGSNGSSGTGGNDGNGSTGWNSGSDGGSSGTGGNDGNGSAGWNSGSDGGSSGMGGNGGSGSNGSTGGNGSGDSGNAGSDSESIGGQLPDMGFDRTYSNVYVCTENGKYYGEIITQPDVTIIYIKERGDSFDSKIKSVLMTMLPKEYNQVWNNYISAATDRTFTVEDRKVRIVAAVNGGHSQIVIYN